MKLTAWEQFPTFVRKAWMVMRLTTLLILTAALQLSAKTYAQKITLSSDGISMEQFFNQLKKQTGYSFLLENGIVSADQKVNVHVTNASLDQILDQVLKPLFLTYKVDNKIVYIQKNLTGKLHSSDALPPTKLITIIDQQPVTISGSVMNLSGEPLQGATVVQTATTNATETDQQGLFKLLVSSLRGTLQISHVGYVTAVIPIRNQTDIHVVLNAAASNLQEVVVSALGITRERKSITYSAQNVSSEEITKVKDVSFVNALAGKVAGAVITKGNFGPGSASKILLRGDKSFIGNSEPLYVIDGVPMFGASDLLANINSEDIEDIEVLKGASASALYGSRAANGVILIVTKKGKSGAPKINVSSQYTVEQPVDLPQYQTNYGQTDPKFNDSWGAKITNGSDAFVRDFFKNGQTWENGVAVSSGNDLAQLYLSYNNTNAKGILPKNDLTRNNFTLKGATQLFNKRLSLDGSVNYTDEKTYNQNSNGGYSALPGIYSFPVGDDWSKYSGANYEVWDPIRQMYVQNWPYIRNETFPNQNPLWVQNKNQNDFFRQHMISSISAKYKILNWLSIQARTVYDAITDKSESRYFATTQSTVAGPNGGYGTGRNQTNYSYSDILLTGSKHLGDNFSLSAMLGASNTRTHSYGLSLSSTVPTSLLFPNYFSVFALNGLFNKSESDQTTLNQAVFGSATFGFKERLFLDVTARKEWSSTVSQSFFYPSLGLSYIAINNPGAKGLSYAKFRGSYAEVGNSLPFGINEWTPPYSLDNSGNIVGRGALPFFDGSDTIELKPERTKSFEFGADIRLFNNKFGLSLTYYNATTYDQVFQIQAPAGAGATNFWINGGTIRNQGIEGTLSYEASLGRISWKPSINFSSNKNQIRALSDLLSADYFALGGSYREVSLFLTRPKGGHYGSYGDMFGKIYEKDASGKLLLGSDGLPKVSTNFDNYVGNANPSFLAGFNNTFAYKNIWASFLIDGRFGGKVFDRTEQWLDYKGLSKRTGVARDNGGVMVEGQLIDTKAFYMNQTGAGAGGAVSANLYDVTNIRLRELALGYNFPKAWGFDLTLSLVGRNLFFFYKKAPFDPEINASTSETQEGISSFTLPSIRSFGISLNAKF